MDIKEAIYKIMIMCNECERKYKCTGKESEICNKNKTKIKTNIQKDLKFECEDDLYTTIKYMKNK